MLLLEAFRDLIAHFLPGKIAGFILPKADYVFLVHPLSFKDARKKYPFAKYLPDKLINLWGTHYWPIIGASIDGLLSTDGNLLKGYIIITPLTPEQMFRDVKSARNKILRGVKLAEKMKASLIGLGGFNSILTHDGKYLIGKAKIAMTTGNSFSAFIAIENLRKACRIIGLDLKSSTLAIVGAAGSVGSACAKILAKEVGKLIIIDINKTESKKLYNQLISMLPNSSNNHNIETYHTLESLNQCDCILTVTSSFIPIIKSKHLKSGVVVVDACQPKNIDLEVVNNRNDVLVIDSGIAETEDINCNMDLGPFKNEVYACLGEVLLLSYRNYYSNYSIGKVAPRQVEELSNYMKNSKIKLAKFRNESGYIEQEKLEYIKEIIIDRKRHHNKFIRS